MKRLFEKYTSTSEQNKLSKPNGFFYNAHDVSVGHLVYFIQSVYGLIQEQLPSLIWPLPPK